MRRHLRRLLKWKKKERKKQLKFQILSLLFYYFALFVDLNESKLGRNVSRY